jgi:hypothetical protein
MNLVEKIFALYPELNNQRLLNHGILVQDDGEGQYIAMWGHPTLPRPTAEQLA